MLFSGSGRRNLPKEKWGGRHSRERHRATVMASGGRTGVSASKEKEKILRCKKTDDNSCRKRGQKGAYRGKLAIFKSLKRQVKVKVVSPCKGGSLEKKTSKAIRDLIFFLYRKSYKPRSSHKP